MATDGEFDVSIEDIRDAIEVHWVSGIVAERMAASKDEIEIALPIDVFFAAHKDDDL